MTATGVLQIALFVGLVLVCVRPLGGYLSRVLEGRRTLLHPLLGPVERLAYRASGVDPRADQHWTSYSVALLLFNLAGLVLLYLLQRLQHLLPLNPAG